MPRLDGVGAGWQTAEVETAVLARDRKIWMLEHCNVSPHPGMNVALYRNRNLFSWKRFFCFGSWRLRLVPLTVVGGYRMNIVGSGIVVHDLYPLVRLHSQHVRLIHATLLIENHGLIGGLEGLLSQPVRNKHDDILEAPNCIGNHFLAHDGSRMLFCTVWIGRHVDACSPGC